jgi:NADPH-dependent curcumin reductase CurA
MTDNQQILLAARPMGMPKATDWTLQTVPVQEPDEGEVLVRVLYLSLDPAMRGWMNDVRSYIKPVGLGEVMRAGGVGEVVASKAEGFKPGDHVSGTLNVQQYALARAQDLVRLDLGLAPLTNYLSVLGMPGLTAYFGLLDVGQPKAGETVVVSGAAGAVGQVAGQIAKLKGCRVVGIAGGTDKCRWVVDDLGFDAAIDYKAEPVGKALRQHCPKGIDVYFDNVGGDILDAALGALALRGRIVICGAISQYNATAEVKGPSKYLSLLVNRARMEGMVIFDYVDRFPEAVREMAGWLAQGKLKAREHIVEGGIPAFPETLNMLFTGENFGKLVLKV